MQVSKVLSFTSAASVKQVNNATIPITPKPVAGWFGDMFKKTDLSDIKEIKTKEGNPRFNKEEMKEIKSYIKKDKLDTTTVKHLADTMLDVKSMSEAYSYIKKTADPMHELRNIKKLANEFEAPYQNWTDRMKEGMHTHITDISEKNKPMFKIRNENDTHGAVYGENYHRYSEYTISAGPFYPSPSSGSSDSSVSSYPSTSTDSRDDWLNPLNPLSPFNPILGL
ncbi:hypothetical protein IKE67_03710 [bacterium]|nr:hypothetical protein [bacterium]